MPAHEISFEIPAKFALSKDIVFDIKSGGSKLGSLLISKGNIEWKPAKAVTKKYRMSWEKFAAFMEDNGRPVK